MAKYDLAFKLAVVKAYLAGEGGYKLLANKFGIPAKRTTACGECLLKKAPSFREKYSEPTAKTESRIIHELRGEFRLAVILEATKFPKATYMYWQKRFNETNPDKEIEKVIQDIFEEHNGNYGYRRINIELRNREYIVNHKKVLRIMNKLGFACTKFTRKSRKYSIDKYIYYYNHKRIKAKLTGMSPVEYRKQTSQLAA
nr:IS3 family transposase [Virgibacillus alimentarius]